MQSFDFFQRLEFKLFINFAKPHITIIVDYNNKQGLIFSCFGFLNIKDCLNHVIYRLNTFSFYPMYSICFAKKLDLEMFTLIPAVESLVGPFLT
jgi:hypothetical protein